MRTCLWMRAFLSLAALGCLPSLRADARLLADLNPGANGSYPSNFTAFGPYVYFSAYSFESGFELWRTDGLSASLATNINPTADDIGIGLEGNDSLPDWLTVFNGALYFSAYEPRRGAELWRHDGTQASRVSDINADQNDTIKVMPGSAWPRELTVLNGDLYFSATSRANPLNYELYEFNGSTVQIADNIHPDSGVDHSSYPTGLSAFGGSLFFMADDGANGWELFRKSGGAATLLNINPGGAESSSYPKYFTPYNGELYFQAFHTESGFELWKTDGTNVAMVADLLPGPTSSYPQNFTVFRNGLYFQAADPEHGAELQWFDGTSVRLAAEINATTSSYPKHLTVFGETLLFAADDGINGWELWKFDGTTATLVTNLNSSGDSFPADLTIHNGALYFTATTPETGYEVWKYDGTRVSLAADVNVGPGDSFPRNMVSANGHLLFSAAADSTSNWEPWVLEEGGGNHQAPSITSVIRNGSLLTITAAASDGVSVKLESSADLRTWTLSGTQVSTNGSAVFVEPINTEAKFFRVKLD